MACLASPRQFTLVLPLLVGTDLVLIVLRATPLGRIVGPSLGIVVTWAATSSQAPAKGWAQLDTSRISLKRRWPHPSLPDSRSWLRPLLIAGLLLVSGSLAFLAATRQATVVLILVIGAGLVLIGLLRPPLGLTAVALAGLIVPYSGPGGLNVTVILVALFLGSWLVQLAVSPGRPLLASSRPVRAVLAFVVIACLAFAVGQLPWFVFAPHAPLVAQFGGFSIVVLSAGTFLLAAHLIRELQWLRRMTWAFLALAALSVLFRSVLPELGLNTQDWFRPMGSVFLIWLVAIAFSQAAYNRDLPVGWRLALGGLLLVTLYVQLVLKFADKSGWVPALVCIAAVVGFRSLRAGLALVPVVGLVAWVVAPSVIGSDAYSISTRFEAWEIVAQIIRVSPILGLGFANYYWYTPLFPLRGYLISFSSHNNYVDIVAQAGLIGLACFVWFLWEVGRVGWRLRESAPIGFARAYVYGALGALVGMVVAGMLGDWVLPFFYNIGLEGFRSSMLGFLFLGGLVSLEQLVSRRREKVS